MHIIVAYFLKYLLAPILAVLFLAILNSIVKAKKKFNVKKAIVLVLVSSIILVIPSLLGLLKNEFVWIGLIITILCYLFLGIMFNLFEKSKLYKSVGIESKVHTLLLVFVILILSGWLYYLIFEKISSLPYAVWAMFSVLWFLIPLLYAISRDYFLNISKPFYRAWEVSRDGIDHAYWDNIDVFKLIQVTVKIKRTPEATDYSSFSVKLPLEVSLGVWFDRFIEDQNVRFPEEMIDTTIEGKKIGWIFYTTRWFNVPLFTKVLDAEKNGKENRIRNKQVIYIRRTSLNEDQKEQKDE